MTIVLTQISDGDEVDAAILWANLVLLRDAINTGAGLVIATNGITAAMHADTSADTTNTKHSTQAIKITDTADYYGSATNQEQVNNAVGAALGMDAGAAKSPKIFGFEFHATDYASVATIVVPADAATTIIVTAGVTIEGVCTTNTYTLVPVEYLVAGAAYVNLFNIPLTIDGSIRVATSPCKSLKLTPTPTKSTTFKFAIPVETGGGAFAYSNYWIRVEGY